MVRLLFFDNERNWSRIPHDHFFFISLSHDKVDVNKGTDHTTQGFTKYRTNRFHESYYLCSSAQVTDKNNFAQQNRTHADCD